MLANATGIASRTLQFMNKPGQPVAHSSFPVEKTYARGLVIDKGFRYTKGAKKINQPDECRAEMPAKMQKMELLIPVSRITPRDGGNAGKRGGLRKGPWRY